MSETKFGGKSRAHSENFSLAKITVASEIFLIFFDFFFEKSK